MAESKSLLIALSGAVGSGKSRTLALLASALAATRRVDGFIAHAGLRSEGAGRGAAHYDLELLHGATVRYAERERGLKPPYRFLADAALALERWQAALSSPDVLILDEFGQLEAQGLGHFKYWAALCEKAPAAIIIAVRDSNIAAIEKRLGRPFDAIVDAADPRALSSIQRLLVARADFERIGWFGAAAGALEVGAGSIVHGINLPLGGLGMVSTQCILLTQAAEGLREPSRVAWVAQIAAGLKALSPAGQRIRPMVAISMQGWLYALALRVFGWNVFAVVLAGALMGTWAGSQGVLLQWLLIGTDYMTALNKILSEAQRFLPVAGLTVPMVLGVYVGTHSAGVAAAAVLAWRLRRRDPDFGKLKRAALLDFDAAKPGSVWFRALLDLLKPSFWLPLAIILLALALAGRSTESLFWLLFRAIAIAWLLFALLRRIPFARAADWLQARGYAGPAHAWMRSMELLGAKKKDRSR